jgi:Ca2+:H+ antiporter
VVAKDVLRQLKERRGPNLAELMTKDPTAFYERVAEIAAQATSSALERDLVAAKHKRLLVRPEVDRGQSSNAAPVEEALPHSGHDAPNWSRLKSVAVLLVATLFYAIIAEILVDTVDVVLENVQIEEKFLGFTLFALVPNTTEFMNAISFAMSGNIELSMEIGSAYALQVLLLQIPALVAFSAYKNWGRIDVAAYTFSLIFPRWDLVMVILCVFLLAHVYAEGKSNYFKGSILIMSYIVVGCGFYNIPVKEEGNL